MTGKEDGWRYRRIIVFALTIFGVVLPFMPDIDPEIYWPVYTLIASAVGAYIGFATAEDIQQKKRGKE